VVLMGVIVVVIVMGRSDKTVPTDNDWESDFDHDG
jgi:hypothetical protein